MYLTLENIVAFYGKKKVLQGVSLDIDKGEIVALMGHNGAGKSTILHVIAGLHRASSGSLLFDGAQLVGRRLSSNVKHGITLVPQGKAFFDDLSVQDNLKMAGYSLETGTHLKKRMDWIYEIFPVLKNRFLQLAGTLSGGEQRQLSVGMAFILNPKLLLLDEPTYGLAPVLAEELLHRVFEITQEFSTSVLLVEDNVKKVVSIANRVYIMKNGNVVFSGNKELLTTMSEEKLWSFF